MSAPHGASGASGAPTITPLDCGWMRQQERTLVQGGSTELSEIPVPAWLVRHPQGVVVFDAGLHPSLVESRDSLGPMAKLFEPVLAADGTVGRRLEQHDVDPLGTFTVVVSHCHFDHVGGLVEMPNARVVAQRDEWSYAIAAGQAGGFDSALIDLGIARIGERAPFPEPQLEFGPQTRDEVTQLTHAVAYRGRWSDLVEVTLGS